MLYLTLDIDWAHDALIEDAVQLIEAHQFKATWFATHATPLLDEIQSQLFDRALAMRQQNTQVIDSLSDFRDYFTPRNSEKPEIHGGFALCHWQEQTPPVLQCAFQQYNACTSTHLADRCSRV